MKSFNKDYFEGVLQLRNPNKEVIDFIRDNVEKRKDVLITKEKKINNGIDLYFTSQRFLRALGKRLKVKFNGELKESRKLFTRKRLTSKDVYRVNVMFRLLNFRVNDIINYRNQKIRIKSVGKLISGVDINNGKKVSFKPGEIG